MADISGITTPTVDVSSYRNALPTGQTSPLQTATQLGALEQQKTALDQQKFNLAKDKWGAVQRELGILANDKNVTRDKVLNRVNMISKVFGIPKEQFDEFIKDVPNDAQGIQRTITDALLRGASVMEQIEYNMGKIGTMNVGGQDIVTRTSPKFGIIPTGQQFPHTLPSTTQEFKGEGIEGERPQFRGPQSYPGIPVAPPGSVQQGAPLGPLSGGSEVPQMSSVAPQAAPGGLPVASPPPPAAPMSGLPRAPANEPVYAAPPVMLEESKKAYTEDQALATQKMTAIKPALQALKLAKQGVKTGPGTPEFNEFVAGLKAFGIVPTQASNDPTVAYQELNKYLNQYIQRSGSRSDADLASKEMSNPNVTTQINPALVKLLENTIAQDRIEAARSGAYDTSKGMSKYLKHRGNFPQSMNLDAASFDFKTPEEREKIFNEYRAKYKKGDSNAIKFFNTLKIMQQLGMHETEGQ